MLRMYLYKNPMTSGQDWVVEDTVTRLDVKSFGWPFAKLRAKLYIKSHKGAPEPPTEG